MVSPLGDRTSRGKALRWAIDPITARPSSIPTRSTHVRPPAAVPMRKSYSQWMRVQGDDHGILLDAADSEAQIDAIRMYLGLTASVSCVTRWTGRNRKRRRDWSNLKKKMTPVDRKSDNQDGEDSSGVTGDLGTIRVWGFSQAAAKSGSNIRN